MIDGISETPPSLLRRWRFAHSSVDDDVYAAAGPVPAKRRELAGFRDDTWAGERGVADIGIIV